MQNTTNTLPNGTIRARIHAQGFAHGREIIQSTTTENGPARVATCDSCGEHGTIIPDYDGSAKCLPCWVDHICYCEQRWHTVTEIANIHPYRQWRTAAEYMRGVLRGMRAAFPKDGPQ